MGLWPETLVREVAERRVVFFIGSGVSKAAHPDLPTWGKLLENLAPRLPRQTDQKLIKTLVRRGAMLDAAQVLREGANAADIAAQLRAIFQLRPTPHHDLYRDLLFMDPKTIVTTNYDEFLERNFEHYSGGAEAHSVTTHDSTSLINDFRSPIRSIVKMHGCVTNPNNLVLDRSSYYEARRKNPGMFSAISALMTVNTVLFLGYSLSDPDIQIILENINMVSSADHPHYALVSKFEHGAMRKAFRATYNVEALEYTAGQHERVPELLAELRDQVVALRSARRIV